MALPPVPVGMPRLAQDVHMQAEIRISTIAGIDNPARFDATVVPIQKTQMYGVTVGISEALLDRDSYVPKEVIVREVSRRFIQELSKSLEAQVSTLFDSIYMNAEKKPVKGPMGFKKPIPTFGTNGPASGTVDPRSEAPEDEEWSPE